MAKKTEQTSYGAKSIQVLEGLDPVRKRPGMYIGGTSTEGLHHLVWEVVNNSIDEAMAGHCTDILVRLLPDNFVEVTDNGRGIPVEIHPQTKKSTLETVMTMLHAGGKFGGEGGYKISGGLHGVGVSVVNALSLVTKVTVERQGKVWVQEYKRGKPVANVKAIGKSERTGTTVAFQADSEIFPEIAYSWTKILEYLRYQAFLTKGVRIRCEDWREAKGKEEEYKVRRHSFYFDSGIVSFVKFLNRKKAVKNQTPVYIEKTLSDISVEVALQFTDGFKEHVFAFANNILNPGGGTHVTGFKMALTRAMNDYAKKNNLIKEKEGAFTSEDLSEGLTAVVSVKLINPQFEGQTKDKLNNQEVRGAVSSVTADGLNEYLETHPADAREMIDKCLLTVRARIAARAAKDAVLRKGALEGMTLPGKLADCTTRDATRSEVYIVEGDSAGGCFDGDTKIALVDGRNLSFKELLAEDRQGKQNFCYTMHDNGHIGVVPILHPRITKKKAEVIKITLDNSEKLICTPDHLFRLVDGTYMSARDLTPDHSLAPLYRKLSKREGRSTLDGYEMVFDPQAKRWIHTHVLSDIFNLKENVYLSSNGVYRHHVDFNKLNNDPTNIQRVSREKHLHLHAVQLEKTLHREDVKIKSTLARQTEAFRKQAREKALKNRELLSANAKKQWENEEYKEFMTQKFLEFYATDAEYRKKNNQLLDNNQKEYWSKDENKEKQATRVREYFEQHPEQKQWLSETAKKQWQDLNLLHWRKEKTKEQWTADFRKKRKASYNQTYLQKALKTLHSLYEKSHKVDKDAYNEVRKESNDKSLIRYETICQRFFQGEEKKLQEAVIHFNHRIKTITAVSQKIDVYDIEVPGTHNFALASGIFVHNSAKQGRNREFQAILPLRGKLVNVEKTSLDKVVKSDTLKPIIIALGVGIGETFDLSKLRYGKVIIMADADVDGSHIRTLLLTFFYRYYESLIRGGHIYIAQPPLYRLQKGKDVRYAYTEEEKLRLVETMKKEALAKTAAKKDKKAKKAEPAVVKALAGEGSAVEVVSDESVDETVGGVSLQRYKGLGEMNPEQLWETTMNPDNRIMLQVNIEDAEEADELFDILMGNEVEPRRRFIQTHARTVKNLDV
ncbi:MAG: DNA gyrase subunit B [Candidatus Moranbacteria bacterium RIFCSPLOWO2_02_FULL_48_19]|nr:MAG: DNA gyrase subunit B [Candidatus Moranbacteria bacterium RIFCSPLOWO2_02_FULL_48_19]